MIVGPLPTKYRLALWNAVTILIIQLLVSGSVYLFMKQQLELSFHHELQQKYDTVLDVIINSEGDIFDVYHLGQLEPILISRNRVVLYATEKWNQLGLSRSLSDDFSSSSHDYIASDDRNYRLMQGWIPIYSYHLFVAMDTEDIDENLHLLATITVSVVAGSVLVVIFASFFLARRAMAPVRAITNKATTISALSLSERIPVVVPSDEIGQMATVFNEMLVRIEDSFHKLQQFTSDASHELRTPLTSMRSVGEVVLQGEATAEEYQNAISSMLEEVERLTDLTQQLLTLARGESGLANLQKEKIDLSSLLITVIDDMQILAEEKSQIITSSIQPEIETDLFVEPFRHAVTNILHNAIRYTPEQGEIRVTLQQNDSSEIILEIEDNGPGIPESERDKVFERFYRIDDARGRDTGGYGLGLAIAKQGIEVNGGNIEFVKGTTQGTMCKILLSQSTS